MSDVKLMELAKKVDVGSAMGEERVARLTEALIASIRGAIGSGKDAILDGFGSFGAVMEDGKPIDAGTRANLLGEVCSKIGEQNEGRAQSVIDAIVNDLKKELLAGNKIILDNLGSLQVISERPKVERQPRGHRLIKPATSALIFKPLESISASTGTVKPTFTPIDELRNSIEAFKESAIMLVVPEHDFFVKTLEYYFEGAGWDVEVYTQIPDALAKIESGKAYLTILDTQLADYQKFCYSLKMRRETTNVPLILLFPDEKSFISVPDVLVVGDRNLAQPFEFRQLLDMSDAEIIRCAEEKLIFNQQMNLHLPTDEASIEKIIDNVHKLLEGSGLGDEGQVAMSAAFREAVVNAAQHGNKYKRDKKIEVQYLLDNDKITAIVKDQGKGFDHTQYVKSGSTKDAIVAARERHAQGRMGGLGIMLMLRCCDRLEYSKAGNQVTLSKNLRGEG